MRNAWYCKWNEVLHASGKTGVAWYLHGWDSVCCKIQRRALQILQEVLGWYYKMYCINRTHCKAMYYEESTVIHAIAPSDHHPSFMQELSTIPWHWKSIYITLIRDHLLYVSLSLHCSWHENAILMWTQTWQNFTKICGVTHQAHCVIHWHHPHLALTLYLHPLQGPKRSQWSKLSKVRLMLLGWLHAYRTMVSVVTSNTVTPLSLFN